MECGRRLVGRGLRFGCRQLSIGASGRRWWRRLGHGLDYLQHFDWSPLFRLNLSRSRLPRAFSRLRGSSRRRLYRPIFGSRHRWLAFALPAAAGQLFHDAVELSLGFIVLRITPTARAHLFAPSFLELLSVLDPACQRPDDEHSHCDQKAPFSHRTLHNGRKIRSDGHDCIRST